MEALEARAQSSLLPELEVQPQVGGGNGPWAEGGRHHGDPAE